MKVSIQVCVFNGWDNNAPAIHEVNDWTQAVQIAYAFSHQFGNTAIRLCKVPDGWDGTAEWIGRLNGTYIQSNEPNKAFTVDWVTKIVRR